MDPRGSGTRARRACESCRRKKTACPAERPKCSLCVRLNQQCVYLPRDMPVSGPHDARKVTKLRPSRERAGPVDSRTELHVNSHSFTGQSESETRPGQQTQNGWDPYDNWTSSQATSGSTTSAPSTLRWSPSQPEPPRQVHEQFGNVYRTQIYFQPLPLFNPLNLVERLEKYPQYLRWSFFALALHYTTHAFYDGFESEAIAFYQKGAQRTFTEFETSGIANVEIVQTMCNLALCSLLSEKPQAWVDLRSTGRMEALRIMTLSKGPQTINDDTHSRCYWSIMLLEDTFTPQFNTIRRLCDPPPETPASPPVPLLHVGQGRGFPDDLPGEGTLVNQAGGINALCFDAITYWSEVAAYLREIRSGKLEAPWLITSTFQQLNTKAFALEANIGSAHLLRNVHLERRSDVDIQHYQEYWTAWIYMQLTLHAAVALLNHPFIHLVALRKRPGSEKPYLFLQQTIDQALYHSGWVARLLKICEKIGFNIQSPFLGFVAAAVGTVAWFFQYASEPTISRAACDNMNIIKKYLDQLSKRWSCIKPKIRLLRSLQDVADRNRLQSSEIEAAVTFEPSKLWQLLDSRLILPSPDVGDAATTNVADLSSPTITVRVTTKLMHPLFEDPPEEDLQMSAAESALGLTALQIWPYVPEDIFSNPTESDRFLTGELYEPSNIAA